MAKMIKTTHGFINLDKMVKAERVKNFRDDDVLEMLFDTTLTDSGLSVWFFSEEARCLEKFLDGEVVFDSSDKDGGAPKDEGVAAADEIPF